MVQSKNGFTLFEVLISLMVLLIILPMATAIISLLQVNDSQHELAVQQFFQFIDYELSRAETSRVSPQALDFTRLDGDHVRFESYNGAIRRRVNERGHELLLNEVEHITFTLKSPRLLSVTVKINKGESYEKQFRTKSW
ncbi:competence type IV pilus minor pilin ComGF [Thalassobacillus sp. CUG 92003]|uniref:competence type IV pilus minor pilin ComGF n=1 Tax=Thalassobacillus sp. CUG 92003 TaxID=2736641 RepID=UPI0015E7BCAA|nr:competence type IV pilus minor pilin ComGF [Thalassobacillus sp. CUG 92003]